MPLSSTNREFDPEILRPFVGALETLHQPFQGDHASTWVLRAERGSFVLKRLPGSAQDSLEREQTVLAALPRDSALELPQAVAFFEHEGWLYGLQTHLEGQNLVHALQQADESTRHRLVHSWGAALRQIHSWNPRLGFRETPFESLQKTYGRTDMKTVVELGPFKGWAAGAVLDELEAQQAQIQPQMVFTHWDYCVPNALVKGERVSGIVDWVTGRYADYRCDLAAASWSLEYNLGSRDYLPSLLEGYGRTPEQLRWFEGLWVLP